MKKEQYIIFVDKRFAQFSKTEIAAVLGDFSEIYRSDKFIVIETDAGKNAATALVEQTIFINNAIPILGVFDYSSGFADIISAIGNSLRHGERFKLEAFNANSNTKQSAKTIEVKIGEALESMGHIADLNDPDTNFSIIFSGNSAYVGRMASDGDHKIMDEFRRSNRETTNKISRAEFKLKEAFEYFKVDVKRIKSAIDIGAAPGGWSRIVSDFGIKVLAIDKAELVYKSPHIIHIRERGDKVGKDVLEKFGKADLLLIDANIGPRDSTELALKFAGSIKDGAYLILTLKIVNGNISDHIKTAMDVLSQGYTSIKLKKLPHNRLEITCFAVKK